MFFEIEENAFRDCSNLTLVNLPESVNNEILFDYFLFMFQFFINYFSKNTWMMKIL